MSAVKVLADATMFAAATAMLIATCLATLTVRLIMAAVLSKETAGMSVFSTSDTM